MSSAGERDRRLRETADWFCEDWSTNQCVYIGSGRAVEIATDLRALLEERDRLAALPLADPQWWEQQRDQYKAMEAETARLKERLASMTNRFEVADKALRRLQGEHDILGKEWNAQRERLARVEGALRAVLNVYSLSCTCEPKVGVGVRECPYCAGYAALEG